MSSWANSTVFEPVEKTARAAAPAAPDDGEVEPLAKLAELTGEGIILSHEGLDRIRSEVLAEW